MTTYTYCPDPECGSHHLTIDVKTKAKIEFNPVFDDYDVHGVALTHLVWDEDSDTRCDECGYRGPLSRFQHEHPYGGEPEED